MEMPEYGTVEFYAEQFADILADIQHDRPDITDNLVEGFRLAITDWKKYYEDQVNATANVENKFKEVFN
jgi:hypothetical protein